MPCELCTYAAARGSWPPGHRGTHCRRCHRSWTGRRQAHCATCCEHFSADGAFLRHWGGSSDAAPAYEGAHHDPAGIELLRQDDAGVWHHAGEWPGQADGLRAEALKSGAGTQLPPPVKTLAPAPFRWGR